MIRKIHKFILSRFRKIRSEIKLSFSPTIIASIGENCLTDAILTRHGLKSITTPYSHARSNLDYVLQLEACNYAGLLDPENLEYDDLGKKVVVRNRKSLKSDSIYDDMHQNGFEFTHHDVISNLTHRKSYLRKVSRIQRYKGKKNYILFYHYRLSKNQDIDLIIDKSIKLQKIYSTGGTRCEMNIFTQRIIESEEDRGIEVIEPSPGIRFFTLSTMKEWAGSDDRVVWAISDDDLIKKMLQIALRQDSQTP